MTGYYLTTVRFLFSTVISLALVQLTLPFLLKSDEFQVLKQNNEFQVLGHNNLIEWTFTKRYPQKLPLLGVF